MPPVARPKGPLTWLEAREQIDYNPETGILTWKVNKPRIRPGARVGGDGVHVTGYRYITICGVYIQEHIFIWFWMTGKWPSSDTIDHKNKTRDDNRWENLRQASHTQNLLNTNRYGRTRGVQKREYKIRGVVWRARIRTKQFTKYLGEFPTEQEAINAFNRGMKQFYGEFFNDLA